MRFRIGGVKCATGYVMAYVIMCWMRRRGMLVETVVVEALWIVAMVVIGYVRESWTGRGV